MSPGPDTYRYMT